MSTASLEPLRLLEDEPVLHHADDGLGLLSFARVIASAALGTSGPLNIGVFADWGQGKTSVLRQAKSLIDDDPAQTAVVTVWFNAWQYEKEEHPIVPLVASIVREVERKQSNPKAKVGAKLKSALADTVRALRAVAYGFSARAKVGVPGLGQTEAGFIAKEVVERFEQLAPGGDPLLDQSLYHHAFETLARLGSQGARGRDAARPKIVVFVDDLDRCLPDQGLKLLESLKLVLAQPGFIFVLAVDRRILEGYLRKRYRDDFGVADYDRSGTSYLDKIVQLPLGLPAHTGRFESYIEHLLALPALQHRSNADVSAALEPLRDVIAPGAAYNPRSLVRLVNNLIVDQRIWVAEQGGEDDERVRLLGLCAVSRILRERLRDLYRALVEDPKLCEEIAARGAPLEHLARTRRAKQGESRLFREELQEKVIAKLDEADLENVIDTGAGKAWLTDHEARQAFDQFLVSRSEEGLPAGKEAASWAVVEDAIRKVLGKSPGEPLSDEDRKSVREIDLSFKRVTNEGLQALSGLKALTRLDLSRTAITSPGLRSLSGLKALTRLYLTGTEVDEAGLESLSGLKRLQKLALSGTKTAGLEWAPGLKGLTTLILSRTRIKNAGLEPLSRLGSLTGLDLSRTAITNKGLKSLSRQESLTGLNLSGTRITNTGMKSLSGLKSLSELNLSATRVNDEGLKWLSKLSGLTALDLSGTKITDEGLEALVGLQSLTTLFLSRTDITDAGVEALARLTRLEGLYLNETGVSDDGLEALAKRLPDATIIA